MKNYLLIFFIAFSVLLPAQEIIISFNGTGASSNIETVEVTNLSNCTSIILAGNEVLNLTEASVGISILAGNNTKIKMYPNPFIDQATISLNTKQNEDVTIRVINLKGEIITELSQNLPVGNHSFNLEVETPGIYSVSIQGKYFLETHNIIYSGKKKGTNKLTYNPGTLSSYKNLQNRSKNDFSFTKGDYLQITASTNSSKYTTIITDAPTASIAYSFNFIECTDFEENNYPVVKIGEQVWMAQNVKSTKYSDGTGIPYVIDETEWAEFDKDSSIKGYCYYNNDESNADKYGPLYNFSAVTNGVIVGSSTTNQVQGVCPIGWHVPSNKEWIELESYLNIGDNGLVLQDKCSDLSADQEYSTNTSGFSALPGGFRYGEDLLFKYKGYNCYFWTSSTSNSGNSCVWYKYISSGTYIPHDAKLRSGFSVRCVQD